MRLPIRALAAAVAAALFGAPIAAASATPAPIAEASATEASAAVADPTLAPTVEVVPGASGVVRAGDDVTFTMRVVNPTGDELEAGVARLYIERPLVADRSALALWLGDSPDAPGIRGQSVATVAVPAIGAGQSATIDPVVLSASSLGFTAASPFGAHRVSAEYASADVEAEGRTAVVTATGSVPSVGLAVAVPIALPPSTAALVPADQLAEYTAVGGLLYRRLDEAVGRPVAFGVDPRILVSIRALGDSAPPSARIWLDRLAAAPNETFPLLFGDADAAGLSQASGSVPTPTGFDLDESLFPAPTPAPETPVGDAIPGAETPGTDGGAPDGTGGNDATGGPDEPDETEGGLEPPLPTADELLAFDYSVTGIGWPRDSTVVAADLDAFADADLTTTILSSDNSTVAALSTTPSASATDGDHAFATSDAALSELLRRASTAETDLDWQAATADLAASLAAVAGERTNRRPIDGRVLLATLARDHELAGDRLSDTLDAIADAEWVDAAALTDALATAPVEVTVADAPEPADRIDQLGRLTDSEAAFSEFATIIEDPAELTRERRLTLMVLASHAWAVGTADLPPAVDQFVAFSDAVTGSVQVADSSTVNFLQADGNLPITVSNGLDYPISVELRVRPRTGILTVLDDSVPLEIEANSEERAAIPVESVANGRVTVEVQLATPAGSTAWPAKYLQVNVQAGWETAVTSILAGAVVLTFALGIVRTVRRRRRLHRSEENPA